MPSQKPHLIMMVGLPRSGKSTHARQLGFPIVSPDAIRLAIHGQRFVASAEPMVWAVAKCMVMALFLAGHKDVILDACNHTAARRKEWEKSDWVTATVEMEASRQVCVDRAFLEDDKEIIPIIDKMHAEYESPL